MITIREKEKGEEKDKKVLKILQNKDEQITSLKNNLNAYSIELNETAAMYRINYSSLIIIQYSYSIYLFYLENKHSKLELQIYHKKLKR